MNKSIKQTGQEQIMVEFKPKKQNIQITYPDNTIVYEDIKGYSLNGPFLIIQLHSDTQHVYPMAPISNLMLTVSE